MAANENPIVLRAIDHVVIRANDLDRMIVFYRDVLGCPLERGPGEAGLAQLRAGSALIDLVDVNGPLGRQGGSPPDGDGRNMDHVCLQVEDWDAEAIGAYLRGHGVDVGEVAERYGAQGFGPSIYIADPEGNVVELKAAAD